MDVPRSAINILLSVLFASIFLIIFFFTYVEKVEKDVILNNLNFTINSLLDGILPFIPPEIKKKMSSFLNSVNLTVDKKLDIATEKSNHKLLEISVYFITILTIVFVIIIGIIYAFNAEKLRPHLKEIAVENLIIVSFIGLTEYIFLNTFAAKFISANPNIIKYNLLNLTKIGES